MNLSKVSNYQRAKIEADKVEEKIITVLQSGKSFRVEAGAGSGKTYSLNRVIEWIQRNKWNEYRRKKQTVICITYTNAAVDVIASRLEPNSFIAPSTIHSFAWNAIKRYQSTLLKIVKDNDSLYPKEGDINTVKSIEYNLGHRYIDGTVMYLYHNDVIMLFSILLDNQKFRNIFSQSYPLILIDEYQDSFKQLIDKFIEYFISKEKGPQFGFFGDAWQTIYQSNNACGLIENDNILEIKKGSNFRSAPKIVDVLNKIRPSLPQISAIDDFEGNAIVITSNDYSGVRRSDRNFKGDLPADILEERLSTFNKIYREKFAGADGTTKILMITHKVLAVQQGYDNLLEIFGDGLRNAEDPILLFFMNTVEPIYEALKTNNMPLLFETLGVKRYPINKKSEKMSWHQLMIKLEKARTQSTKAVLDLVISSKMIPLPSQVELLYKQIHSEPDTKYQNTTVGDLASINYSEFISAISFLRPTSSFSTEHGVKGEEYDNIIFVIGRGWNNYQFDNYIPMLNSFVPEDKRAAFERNRNLFYVCCSRPRKRLVLFVTILVEGSFKSYLEYLVGKDNIYSYSEFIAKFNN